MTPKLSEEKVKEWLNAAYEYYWGFDDPGMSDYQWDYLAREIGKDLSVYEVFLPKAVFNKMKENEWEGGSLFFVPKDAYK